MFIGIFEKDGQRHGELYDNWDKWQSDTFCADYWNIIELKVKGKTYKERKADLEDKAIEYSNAFCDLVLSWGDLFEIGNFFARNGKRYGLLKDFRENAIC